MEAVDEESAVSRSAGVMFPHDVDIEEIRAAVKGRDDFREVMGPDFSSFVYFLGMAKDIFPDPAKAPDERTARYWRLRRECRGIIVSRQTGKVISRRFHKFFNVNETEEVEASKINLNRPFIILEKLDGSMVCPFYTEGKLRFATKNGVTDTSRMVEEFIARSKIPYNEYSALWIEKGYSPIYEWCSQRSRVVLDYPEDTLTLISVRHVRTGEYFPFFEMQKHAKRYGVPVVSCRTAEEVGVGSVTEFAEFQKTIREKNIGLEGFVIRFENGEMYKIKTAWYCDLNKTLDLISRSRSIHGSEMDVWKVILEEKYDDLRTWLAETDRKAMDHFAMDLLKEIGNTCKRLYDTIVMKRQEGINKKQFATFVGSLSNYGPLERALLFRIWDMFEETTGCSDAGQDDDHSRLVLIRQEVIESVLKNCSKRPLFEKARALMNNITYKTYIDMYELSRSVAKHVDE